MFYLLFSYIVCPNIIINKRHFMKNKFLIIFPVLLTVSITGCNNNNDAVDKRSLDKDLAILYTNDVHCAVGDDKTLGYSELSQFKKDLLAKDNYVTLADCGDAIQGAPIGTLSNRMYIADIMEEVGYDVAIPGNHEFDYGMDNFLTLAKNSSFPYVSCNFMDLKTNKTVFEPYIIKQYDDIKVAYLGITTPKIITSSSPKYFQDSDGNYIFWFCRRYERTFLFYNSRFG